MDDRSILRFIRFCKRYKRIAFKKNILKIIHFSRNKLERVIARLLIMHFKEKPKDIDESSCPKPNRADTVEVENPPFN